MLLSISGAMTLTKLTFLINLRPPGVLFLRVFCLTWKAFRKLNSKPWLVMSSTLPSGGEVAGVSSRKLKIHFSVYTVHKCLGAEIWKRGVSVGEGRGRQRGKGRRGRGRGESQSMSQDHFHMETVQGIMGACSSG